MAIKDSTRTALTIGAGCALIAGATAWHHSPWAPDGAAIDAALVLPVVIAVLQPYRAVTFLLALLSSLAAVILHAPASGETLAASLAAMLLPLTGIWLTAYIVLLRQRIEPGAAASATELKNYLDTADIIYVVLDPAGTVLRINEAGSRLLGLPEAEIIGKNWIESFIPPSHRGQIALVHSMNLRSDGTRIERFENPVLTGTGEIRTISWRNTELRDGRGRIAGTISSGIDVTDSRRAQDQLARSRSELSRYQEDLQQSFKNLEDYKFALDQAAIVAIADSKGLITYANDRFCEISGYSRDELLGRDHRILNSGLHPRPFMENLWNTIQSGKTWRGIIRNKRKDGSFYWVATTIIPFLGRDEKPYQYVSIRFDITPMVEAETARQRTVRQMQEQATLARLGEMSAVVAHEVKNPLAGISGALQVIARRMPADNPDLKIIQSILDRIDTLHKTMTELLNYARPRVPRFMPLDLVSLFQETVRNASQDADFRQVHVELSGDQARCTGDTELLRGVFLNLLINAAHAMNNSGTIRTHIACDQEWCRVTVTDTGKGIPPEMQERIFEPFFTTKNRGAGLGLAITHRSVEAHGGRIEVKSAPGEGTTMTVILPVRPPSLG
ncbi:MAG: PAS domain S-box protein [Deltaproteobacteria bacterium]|nr:PAS domain S-box protein [Deltaproteobacteria bacterium]